MSAGRFEDPFLQRANFSKQNHFKYKNGALSPAAPRTSGLGGLGMAGSQRTTPVARCCLATGHPIVIDQAETYQRAERPSSAQPQRVPRHQVPYQPADPPPNPDMPWGKKPPVEMTAAEAFEAKIAARKAATGKEIDEGRGDNNTGCARRRCVIAREAACLGVREGRATRHGK